MKTTNVLAVTLSLLLSLALVACGDDDGKTTVDSTVDGGGMDFTVDTGPMGDLTSDTGPAGDLFVDYGPVSDLTVDGPVVTPDSTVDGPVVTPDSTVDGPVVTPDSTVDGPVVTPDTGPVGDGPVGDAPVGDGPVGDGPVTDTVPGTDVLPLSNATCASPEALTLTGGTVTVTADTTGQANEFDIDCGGYYIFTGGQLYYSITFNQGTQYLVTMDPGGTWDPALYIFQDATCDPTTINTECGGTGGTYSDAVGDVPENIVFSPSTTGTYFIATDGYTAGEEGSFTLTIQELTAPANDTCAAAEVLTLTGGTVTVTGQTFGAANDVALTGTDCTGDVTDGADVFYTVSLTGGTTYRIELDSPDFDESLYLFESCADVAGTCGTDMGADSYYSSPEVVIYTPAADGIITIGVDTSSSTDQGSFTLTIEEFSLAGNDTCGHAIQMSFVGGVATETGDTAFASNTVALTSGNACTGYGSNGADLFYKIDLTAATAYTITLTPDASYDPMLYVFTDCADPEGTCAIGADDGFGGDPETVTITPTADTTYFIGVDSFGSSASGSFTLTVQ